MPSAGAGRRFGAEKPKQYVEIAGKPTLAHTLALFDSMPECAGIVVATDNRSRIRETLFGHPLHKSLHIVDGGTERQDSVANTLTECGPDDTIVLIHDAARPCLAVSDVRAVVKAVQIFGAAILATRARDTIKIGAGGAVCRTIDRDTIWLAQTPQGATAGAWRQAFAKAAEDGFYGTDDSQLLERIGKPVALVPGNPLNLKITTAADLLLAEAILRSRSGGELKPSWGEPG